MKWVLEKKLIELTGLSKKGVEHRIERGIWLRGTHYKKGPDGRLWFNVPQIERWLDAA